MPPMEEIPELPLQENSHEEIPFPDVATDVCTLLPVGNEIHLYCEHCVKTVGIVKPPWLNMAIVLWREHCQEVTKL